MCTLVLSLRMHIFRCALPGIHTNTPLAETTKKKRRETNQETMTLQQRKIHEGQHMGTHKVSKEMLARSPLPLRPK